MKPQDGLLILALLVIALAAGCEKQEKEASTSGTPGQGSQVTQPAAQEAPRAAVTETNETEVAADATGEPAVDDDPVTPATEELARAQAEIQGLASDAAGLREAMLEANFKRSSQHPAAKDGQ